MCSRDDYVSPDLRRPLHHYKQFLRERAERARRAHEPEPPSGTPIRSHPLKDPDDVERSS